QPGSSIGTYEIVAALGKGGMGEVYRARDSKLKRDVAIKSLPEAFAGDTDRLTRFQREAEALAALNHPNIGAIYGLEESDVGRFIAGNDSGDSGVHESRTSEGTGLILFAPSGVGPLLSVPAAGGETKVVTKVDSGQRTHRVPRFLPDSRHFLFYVGGSQET